ncbi:MAG: TRAP transporter small permease, partial [Dehalococcoidales bacterium]|nr:TRAP transporter small permease [Dehalococcoidales bacterium]
METFERFVGKISRLFDYIARFGVLAMMILVVANVILRIVWKSIVGTYDYVCIIGAVLVALALAYCGYKKGHIEIEILMSQLPERVQGTIGSIVNLLSLGFFSIVAWQLVLLGNEMRQKGETTMTLYLPFHPYLYLIAFCCVTLM